MTLKTTNTTAREATQNARAHARSNQTLFPRLCLRFVRQCWEIPALYGTAIEAWKNAEQKHAWKGDVDDIPWGAPVFFKRPDAGPNDAGHVAICGGHDSKGRRIFRSNDVVTLGGIDVVNMNAFTEKWGMECLGWTKDLNGYALNLPQSPNQRKAARRR